LTADATAFNDDVHFRGDQVSTVEASAVLSDRDALAEKVRQFFWFHSIDLGNGIVTPGAKSPAVHGIERAAFFDPVELTGRSVIDIGAWNGIYSFEAKRRGAARVLATDHLAWNHSQLRGREAFDLARTTLGIDLEVKDIDLPDLTPDSVGTFDVVLFLGVFYHLLEPVAALRRIAKLAREVLIVESYCDALQVDRPAMIMYPGAELNNDASNWWGPNPACMVALLKECGFAKVDAVWSVHPRAVFHAWRSDALRRAGSGSERIIQMAPPRPPQVLLTRRQKLHRGWRLLREGLGLRRPR